MGLYLENIHSSRFSFRKEYRKEGAENEQAEVGWNHAWKW